jgi:hypothetical protein
MTIRLSPRNTEEIAMIADQKEVGQSDLIKTAIAQTFNQKPVKGITAPYLDRGSPKKE